MGKLYKFPLSRVLTIYLPLGSSPDDEYEAITIPDDALSRGTIYKGDVVLVKLGLIQSRGLHAVLTPTNNRCVGFLAYKDDLIYVKCNNDEYEPKIFKRDEIKILGRVVQVYPGGDISQRWELIRVPQRRRNVRAR